MIFRFCRMLIRCIGIIVLSIPCSMFSEIRKLLFDDCLQRIEQLIKLIPVIGMLPEKVRKSSRRRNE